LVAASTRTLTGTSVSAPTRRTRFVSSTRSSRACISSGISVISSSSSVPLFARSNTPACMRDAPVKLPFSKPNNSASIKVGGMAPQLIATNGPPARALPACSDSATSSLPQPLSPQISTAESVGATLTISRRTASIASLLPMSLFSIARESSVTVCVPSSSLRPAAARA
jgi:hypothetical protein